MSYEWTTLIISGQETSLVYLSRFLCWKTTYHTPFFGFTLLYTTHNCGIFEKTDFYYKKLHNFQVFSSINPLSSGHYCIEAIKYGSYRFYCFFYFNHNNDLPLCNLIGIGCCKFGFLIAAGLKNKVISTNIMQ